MAKIVALLDEATPSATTMMSAIAPSQVQSLITFSRCSERLYTDIDSADRCRAWRLSEGQHESRAPRRGLQQQLAALADDGLAGEAETDAAALRLGGEERMEDFGGLAVRHARAVVLHHDRRAVAGGMGEEAHGGRPPAAGDGGLGGVGQEVEQRLGRQVGVQTDHDVRLR